jgi:hypothetical protein
MDVWSVGETAMDMPALDRIAARGHYAALPATGRLSINARRRDWFCAILLMLITYPPAPINARMAE